MRQLGMLLIAVVILDQMGARYGATILAAPPLRGINIVL